MAFAAIARPRLAERLAASAKHPIALLVAPAGYGKSVVLRQYLAQLTEPYVLFGLRAEHASLLSFLRGLTEALGENAPHAMTALAGAYERNTASPKRGADLARWLHAHLESYEGVVAIDDMHVADADPEVARFLSALIERTKGRIRWILASRSTAGLPVGTWSAYGDADLPVDERDLRLTLEEARLTAAALGLTIGDGELGDLLALTEGWPAAMGFALRTSTRSSDLRNVSALTREMTYRYLAEQVYSALDDDERELLDVAIALPVIDVRVLERAGFDRALPMVERLRERTAFIHEESPGIYHCHDLFREFLRHQSALGGKRVQQVGCERAARALEAGGDAEHAIVAYANAGQRGEVLRLLERHGFELLERARGDVVARAIEALPEAARRENPTLLALQGALQAIAGRFVRAESLLRRALARAGNDRDLVATTSLRLASLVGNKGREVTMLLGPVADGTGHRTSYRAEALSLLAARHVLAGDISAARESLAKIEQILPDIDADAARAKIFHHLGIVSRHIGALDQAFERLVASSDLAAELHLYGLASRANAVLSNLVLHEEDDVDRQLAYAEIAAAAATKAGDAFALQTALLQVLSAQMRKGEIEKSIAVEQQLAAIPIDETAARYIRLFRSMRLGWEGRFGEAHRLMASSWRQVHFEFDRVLCGTQYALFLALDEQKEEAGRLVAELIGASRDLEVTGLFRKRSLGIGQVLCAVTEIASGRYTSAERVMRAPPDPDEVVHAASQVARGLLWMLRHEAFGPPDRVYNETQKLAELGYRDISRLLTAVCGALRGRAQAQTQTFNLTPAEKTVLRLLSEGLRPKEIADQTTRSVNTVRVHIAKAIEKLNCHGGSEAVEIARRNGII